MNIQGLTLMMAVMVYAAPSKNRKDDKDVKERLKEIKESAQSLKTMIKNETVDVPKLTSDDSPTCVDEFFCLAEKALNNTISKIPNDGDIQAKTLNALLHMYNQNTTISCSLRTNIGYYRLQRFLDDIVTCSEERLRQINNMHKRATISFI